LLNNPTLLPLFSLTCQPLLEQSFNQTLKEIVENEDKYIDDNKEELEEDIQLETQKNQPLSEIYSPMQV